MAQERRPLLEIRPLRRARLRAIEAPSITSKSLVTSAKRSALGGTGDFYNVHSVDTRPLVPLRMRVAPRFELSQTHHAFRTKRRAHDRGILARSATLRQTWFISSPRQSPRKRSPTAGPTCTTVLRSRLNAKEGRRLVGGHARCRLDRAFFACPQEQTPVCGPSASPARVRKK